MRKAEEVTCRVAEEAGMHIMRWLHQMQNMIHPKQHLTIARIIHGKCECINPTNSQTILSFPSMFQMLSNASENLKSS